jgi:hypothetical protein
MWRPRGQRGDYPGTFRSSKNRWGMKVWIDGQLHYLGAMADRADAAAYVRLVESRYPNRLRRKRGTLCRHNKRWVARGPRPQRSMIGTFETRWAGEQVMKRLGLRGLVAAAWCLSAVAATAQDRGAPFPRISFDPPAPVIADDAPLLTPIAQIIVTMSNGSRFRGSLGFGAPNFDAGGCIGIAGRELVLTCQLPPAPTVIYTTITATRR